MHDTVVELDYQHELLICAQSLCYQLTVLNFVIIESLTELQMVFKVLINSVPLPVLCWDNTDVTTKDEEALLVNVLISVVRLLVILEPGVILETYQAALFESWAAIFLKASSLNENHDVTISFLALFKAFLLDHLRVVDKADELPFTEMKDSLRHIVCHVNDGDFFVSRSECFVRKQWVVDNP